MKYLLVSLIFLSGVILAADRPNILFALGDNWLYDHAGANGDPMVKTPVFDRISREGMRFTRAFCPVPSCSPTRSCILTGRAAHQLAEAASLWSLWPAKLRVFTDALRDSGYRIGYSDKGWSPGNHVDHGRTENPAGPRFKSFGDFISQVDDQAPFFFWLGDTHTSLNKWPRGAHQAAGIDPAKVRVPAYLPDTPEVRADIADYLAAVQNVDTAIGAAIEELVKRGLLENTIIIQTSDNGWQMPHGLAHCYDAGTHVPLAVRWPGKVKSGAVSDAFISLTDLAPTFLDMVGVKPWPEMTGRSFVDVLQGRSDSSRDHVFIERERHANVRRGDLSYPVRGIRNERFLYLRNLRPDRWPAGDPELHFAVGPFGDVDGSVTKEVILSHRDQPEMRRFFDMNFAKRPAEELYDLATDPDQVHNLADNSQHADTKAKLSSQVDAWMHQTSDPRLDPACDAWDSYPYYGGRAKAAKQK
ncbi:MAG: Choline-sulfatase [Verrucomicrobiota bacterium]